MTPFSERHGYKKAEDLIQKESINHKLKVSIWNVIQTTFLRHLDYRNVWDTVVYNHNRNFYNRFREKILTEFFVVPIDTIDNNYETFYELLRKRYFKKLEWYEIYDLIEIISSFTFNELADEFSEKINAVLQRQTSAYRLLDRKIVPIADDNEFKEIDEAIDLPFKTVNLHLTRSLELLSDRDNPDYRNSIKESISAVETLCKKIADNDKATLKQALQEIEKSDKITIHSALKDAYSKLYGYTNDSDGIRHALLEEDQLDFEDAKFMLVSASAFINYLKVKSDKANISII
ncbi:MAG: AbiJ-NTD4 domain-containing protein [Nanoarchaeota archaeon]